MAAISAAAARPAGAWRQAGRLWEIVEQGAEPSVRRENLVRHPLASVDVGRNKAMALARRLAGIHPTATITGCPIAVPVPEMAATESARHALDTADVIVDCTASESVLDWHGRSRAPIVGKRER